jgi:hypothetical protein
MSTSLVTDQIETAPGATAAAPDPNRRLRALRTRHEETPRTGRPYPGLPTAWGRWPTCACPHNDSTADRTAACC